MAADDNQEPALPPWEPLGRALLAYLDGDEEAHAVVIHEDDRRSLLTAAELCREEGFPPAEEGALDLCRGRVLEVGAGAGAHALELAEEGLEVVALDVSPRAVEAMRRRGVAGARVGDVFDPAAAGLGEERFDTLLLMMNGAGIAGDLAGLGRLLAQAHLLLAPGGCLLVDSGDLRTTDDPRERLLIEERERQGRYFGEVVYRMEHAGRRGAAFPWLFVDPETLGRYAERAGWACQIAYQGDDGAYLARLVVG